MSILAMYTIGEFSRITSVTVKALRHYHEKGILEPSHINKHTRYRYYTSDDINKLHLISTLQLINFNLSEIKEVLSSYNDESDITQILTVKRNLISQKIEDLKKASAIIDITLNKEKSVKSILSKPADILIKKVPDIEVAAIKWEGAYKNTGAIVKKLYKQCARYACGPIFNLYFHNEYQETATIETCLPINIKHKKDHEYITIPGRTYITLVHIGSYEDLGLSYAKLFEHIKNNNIKTSPPIREIYHKGPGVLLKGKPKNYATEIQIPIIIE
ncbi:MerR family transcriptional regulator [Pseudomonas sp. HK3]